MPRILLLLTTFSLFPLIAHAQPGPKTRAERTNYEETSRYEDVRQFIKALENLSPLIHTESFGVSREGRNLPLMVLANPPVNTPAEAAGSGKPVVFVMANIHAGEVEGKEASLHLARRLLTGNLRPLLDKLVILIAPDYNADGNEKISTDNRVAQNGPIGGVGVRENAQGLDLNRDYIKADAPETRALLRLLVRWDPHVTVDLHTTNGSYHGYHLTYSIPLNPSNDANIAGYQRKQMMPALADAMARKHQFRTYYYGNFAGRAPRAAGEADQRSWEAFSPAPRVGTNYVGMRNRLAILSEAYSYLDFRDRVRVTDAFVEEIFLYVADHADGIRALTARADADAKRRGTAGPPVQLGVGWQYQALPEKVDILVGEVTKVVNPRSGRQMTAVVPDKFTAVKMTDYGAFAPKRLIPTGLGYLFAPEPGLRVLVEKLQAHGIVVEELTEPYKGEVEQFAISGVDRSPRPLQGRREVTVSGSYKTSLAEFPAGTLLVRAAQPLGTLAAYLLEPESDDGLTLWSFLDAYVAAGKVHPVHRVVRDFHATSRVLNP